jgi:SAM-dependent methyltransferase
MKELQELKYDALTIFKQVHYKPNKPLGKIIKFMSKQNYMPPEFYYEALLNKLVTTNSIWLDVGCGKDLFPQNPILAERLSKRARLLVGIDPDSNIEDNAFVHKKVHDSIDNYETSLKFDLITCRMVAEHIESPKKFVSKMFDLAKPGGCVVLYTVNKFGWVPFLTYITPLNVHLFFQKKLWDQSSEKDSFHTFMRMNTKRSLNKLFLNNGFRALVFQYLEEASIFFKKSIILFWFEIKYQKFLTLFRLNFLQNNLLAVYKKESEIN